MNEYPAIGLGLALHNLPLFRPRSKLSSDEGSLCSFTSSADIFLTPPRKLKNLQHKRLLDLPCNTSKDSGLCTSVSDDKSDSSGENIMGKHKSLNQSALTVKDKNIPEDSEISSSDSSSNGNMPRPSRVVSITKPALLSQAVLQKNTGSSSDSSSDSEEEPSPAVKLKARPILNAATSKTQLQLNKKQLSLRHKMSASGSSNDSEEELDLPSMTKYPALTKRGNAMLLKDLPVVPTSNGTRSLGKGSSSESDSSDESRPTTSSKPTLSLKPRTPSLALSQKPNTSMHALSDSDSSSDSDNVTTAARSKSTVTSSLNSNNKNVNDRTTVSSSNIPLKSDRRLEADSSLSQSKSVLPNRPRSSSSSEDSSKDSSDSGGESSSLSVSRRPLQEKTNPKHATEGHQKPNSDSSDDSESDHRPSTSKSVPKGESLPSSSSNHPKNFLIGRPLPRREHNSDDDDSSDMDAFEPSPRKSRVEPLAKPTLKSVLPSEQFEVDNSPSALYVEDLGPDDEYWIVQTPKDVSKKILMNQMLNLNGTSRFSVQGENGASEYVARTFRHEVPREKTCLLRSRRSNQFQAVPMPSVGQIVVTRSLKVPKIRPFVAPAERERVPLPLGLKIRHPLFGSDYKTEIQERDKSHDVPMKTRKKSKKRKSGDTEVAIAASPPINAGETGSDKKRKKKDKKKEHDRSAKEKLELYTDVREQFEEFRRTGVSPVPASDEVPERRRSKKNKHEDEVGRVEDVGGANEDDPLAIDHDPADGHEPKLKRKKNKADEGKRDSSAAPSESDFRANEIGVTGDGTDDSVKRKKNKKDKSERESSDSRANGTGNGKDVSGDDSLKRKKKKNKKDKRGDAGESLVEFGNVPKGVKAPPEDFSFFQHVRITSTPTGVSGQHKTVAVTKCKSREFEMNTEERSESAELFNELIRRQNEKVLGVSQASKRKREGDSSGGEEDASGHKKKRKSSGKGEGVEGLGDRSDRKRRWSTEFELSEPGAKKSRRDPITADNPAIDSGTGNGSEGAVSLTERSHKKKKKKDKDHSEGLPGIEVERANSEGAVSSTERSHKKKKKKDKDDSEGLPGIEVERVNSRSLPVSDWDSGDVGKKKKKKKDNNREVDNPEGLLGNEAERPDSRSLPVSDWDSGDAGTKKKKKTKDKYVDMNGPGSLRANEVERHDSRSLPVSDWDSGNAGTKKKKKKDKYGDMNVPESLRANEVERPDFRSLPVSDWDSGDAGAKKKKKKKDKNRGKDEEQSVLAVTTSDRTTESLPKTKKKKKKDKDDITREFSFVLPEIPAVGTKKDRTNEPDPCGFDSDASIRKLFITQKSPADIRRDEQRRKKRQRHPSVQMPGF